MRQSTPFASRPSPGGLPTTVAQGADYVATGVWPCVSMRSFLAVTGPKADLRLVKTVGDLRRRVPPELKLLGAGSPAVLGAIEGAYVLRGRIPRSTSPTP